MTAILIFVLFCYALSIVFIALAIRNLLQCIKLLNEANKALGKGLKALAQDYYGEDVWKRAGELQKIDD